MIGEEIEYEKDSMKGLKRSIWFCCCLGIIVFSFLAYAGLVDKNISVGGMRGAPVSHNVGSAAITYGYIFYTFAVTSFGIGFCYNRFRVLIWLKIAAVWAGGLFMIHQLVI